MRVHHLAFRTHDLARLELFYAQALGLVVLRRDAERSVWLDAGGSVLMLERAEPGEAAGKAGEMDLVAFEVSPDQRAFYMDTLTRARVPVEGSTDFTLYFRDPDGRRIGLSSYPTPLV